MPRHASIRPQGHSGEQYPIRDSGSNYCLRDTANYMWDLGVSYIILIIMTIKYSLYEIVQLKENLVALTASTSSKRGII